MDKRKAEGQGGVELFNRIKRDLLVEVAALAPTDRVLVIGTASEPFNCKRKDETALVGAFEKHIHVPLPDDASRQVLPSSSECPGPKLRDREMQTSRQSILTQVFSDGHKITSYACAFCTLQHVSVSKVCIGRSAHCKRLLCRSYGLV